MNLCNNAPKEMGLTKLFNIIKHNHLVYPGKGLITSLLSGESFPKTRRMAGEALAHVQGGDTQRPMRLSQQSHYHSPVTFLVGDTCLKAV